MSALLSQQQKQVLGEVSILYTSPPPIKVKQPGRLCFGLIADPQYADVPTEYQRYYRHSLVKLSKAIATLNQYPLDFVVTLGDIVDRHWQDYDKILPLYQQLQHPHFAIIGNHDAAVIGERLASQQPPLPLPKQYYAVKLPGFRLLWIDGNDISFYCTSANGDDYQRAKCLFDRLHKQGAIQAQPWNGAISERQLNWLQQQLQQAQQRQEQVLIFSHYPVSGENSHNLWNCQQVTSLLCHYAVRAFFCGHDHRGGHQRIASTDFVTIKGMVDNADSTPFAVVDVDQQQLKITGFGSQPCLYL